MDDDLHGTGLIAIDSTVTDMVTEGMENGPHRGSPGFRIAVGIPRISKQNQ
jgi:hypothetical protein